jgi:nicotinate-nucleotide adenylyltransferase
MKIGIFGGCFNPPHKMHKNIALELIKNNYLDKVIYVPTGNKYNKTDLINDVDRFNMLKLMCNNNVNLDVSDYEFNNTLTYTYQTLDHFKKEYPSDEIYFICGADNILDIENWRNSDYLLETYKFIVINRDNKDISKIVSKYEKKIIVAKIKELDVCSTRIRNDIKSSRYRSFKLYNF